MKAIVYTSATGHTAEYARMLGEKTGLPVYALQEVGKQLPRETEILYLGWLFANGIKGYKKAARKYRLSAVLAVGLCDTGTAIAAVRKANAIPEEVPLFTLQGGLDTRKLRGIHKHMLGMLAKVLSSKKERTADEERMLYLVTQNASYVSEENIAAFLEWYQSAST